jgi:hypothetical protein
VPSSISSTRSTICCGVCRLIDRHRRGQPLDEVDVRLVHLAEELPGVRRQRLHVAPLALGEDRVEGEAGLAGAGQPGEHDQAVPREVQVDVLEVVLARAADDQSVCHRSVFRPELVGRGRPDCSDGHRQIVPEPGCARMPA